MNSYYAKGEGRLPFIGSAKNPCRVWTWNRRVAAQPPPSAPAMPITQVKMRVEVAAQTMQRTGQGERT